MTNISPTQKADRIISLDILRGFALLGIFIMNMLSYAMVSANYTNPMAEGPLTGADEYAFIFSYLFANQKFMSLFSILFGAGVLLMSDRMVAQGKSPAQRHYFRNFWLLLFGLAHAYCLWYGDILVPYALCAIWVFLLRKKSAKTLFIIAGVLYAIAAGINLFFGLSLPHWPPEALADLCADWTPAAEKVAAEVAAYRGSWFEQMPFRTEMAILLETVVFLISFAWHITGLMLIGMGLYKLNILSALRSDAFYKKMMLYGFGIGLLLTGIGLYQNYQHNWACDYSFFLGGVPSFIGSLPIALGYIGLLMLLCKSSWITTLKIWLAPVGQMALTNYLMQSIIATFIFYGHGLGLFASVGRAEQWLYILAVWVFQIIFSRWWLGRFRYGPFEWLWRSLTYWKLQKMKK